MDEPNFFNLAATDKGVLRELAEGLTARVFVGDQAMLSVVTLAPNAEGQVHDHPQEQWGVLLEGDGVRIQEGKDIPVKAGDFWRTPGGVAHGMRAGPQGAKILDVFAPPREDYKKAGKGFAAD